ncbi:MAG: calcium/sodium antiporter [Bacteroidales bacterium]|jgi:cation:H+ antiporter|nr:calcium/sodium antiporter [Bacteroidales bacterium]
MALTVLLLLAGLALILFGANYLTEGSADMAKRMRISEFIIGLTVVAMGTSLPEFVVSFLSALQGKADVAVGNVVGSNIFNGLLILGVTALILPLHYTRDMLKKDMWFGILAAGVLFVVASDTLISGYPVNTISRSEGLLMLGFFLVFIIYTVYSAQGPRRQRATKRPVVVKRPLWFSSVMIVCGLAGLIFGGELFLNNAIVLARRLGASETVIAVTLLAGGTSLPELSASVISAVKKKPGLALGNVIGSNIFNVFFILGTSASIFPLTTGGILPGDLIVMFASSVLLFLCAFTFRKAMLDRTEGVIFIMLYIAYIVWLLNR